MRLSLVALLAFAPLICAAAFFPETLARLDRQFQGDAIALSPDGKRIAYTIYEKGKLSLVICEYDKKVNRVATLVEDTKSSKPPSQIKRLKWLSPLRLLIQTADGVLYSCDEEGRNAVKLWNPKDDGLFAGSEITRPQFVGGDQPQRYLILPGPARFVGTSAENPESVFIESVANIGPESFSNLFLVDSGKGTATLTNKDLYLYTQVALYGRGDMLLWPPPPKFGDADPMKFPPLRPSSNAMYYTREQARAFEYPSFEPERGGPVSRDSSSTGRMLYDRDGKPRILYSLAPGNPERKFLVTQGHDVFVPNIPPRSLDEWLGQPKAKEFVITFENFFAERSFPLAFDYDPDVLYYASNIGRDAYGIHKLNLLTKAREDVTPPTIPFDLAEFEPDFPDSNLVFDDHTHKMVGIRINAVRPMTAWVDPELGSIQADLDRSFPRHTAEIVDWDADRSRILVRVTAEDDPGAYFMFERGQNRLDSFISRAPWLEPKEVMKSASFSFETPQGVRLSGSVTLPDSPKVSPPPLMIYCQGGLWDRADTGFNREAEMLANMGLAVIRLNFRGTSGFGRKHLMAIQEGLDSIPLEDMIAAVEWMAGKYKIDRKRVVVMGEGFGGYLALRAMQLRPDIFKCAISLNAPTNLGAWAGTKLVNSPPMYVDGGGERVTQVDFTSMVRSDFVRKAKRGSDQPAVAGEFKKPVLVIENPHSGDITPWSSLITSMGLGFSGTSMERLSISGPFENGSPDTRKRVFQRIEEFLNERLYEYGSEIKNLRPK